MSGTQLEEKEIFDDVLSSQKMITSTYNTFTNECATPKIRDEFLKILNEMCIRDSCAGPAKRVLPFSMCYLLSSQHLPAQNASLIFFWAEPGGLTCNELRIHKAVSYTHLDVYKRQALLLEKALSLRLITEKPAMQFTLSWRKRHLAILGTRQ